MTRFLFSTTVLLKSRRTGIARKQIITTNDAALLLGAREPLRILPTEDASAAQRSPDHALEDRAAFASLVHRSLDPRQVAFIAAQELRPIGPCDRVSVLERRGSSFRVIATSGQLGIPPKSRRSLLLQRLAAAVLKTGQPFELEQAAINPSLPDDWSRRLDAYLAASDCKCLVMEPLFEPAGSGQESTVKQDRRRVIGAVVMEHFSSDSLDEAAVARIRAELPQAALAFHNARRYARLANVPGLPWLSHCWSTVQSSRAWSLGIGLTVLVSLIGGAAWVERPFEVVCQGKLMPRARRQVYAGLQGEIAEVFVRESEVVQPGQPLARMTSRELENSILEQTGLLQTKFKAREAARADLHAAKSSRTRETLTRDQAQLEMLQAEIRTIQQQLELLDAERELLLIEAPAAGTITTPRPEETLARRPVRRGERLLEIMDEQGEWALELKVPERDLGRLTRYHARNKTVGVAFRLLSNPRPSHQGRVLRIADRTTPTAEGGAYCAVLCEISDIDSLERRVGTEVAARVDCGRASLLEIWFADLAALLYRNWWL